MLPLDDPRWRSLNGGYHTPFNAAPRLETLFSAGPTALAMVATVELNRPLNPPPLPELEAAYREAIERLPSLIGNHAHTAWDKRTTQGAVACIALARGQRRLASVYLDLDIDTCQDALEEAGINVVDA